MFKIPVAKGIPKKASGEPKSISNLTLNREEKNG
jgi:hypothetical protein